MLRGAQQSAIKCNSNEPSHKVPSPRLQGRITAQDVQVAKSAKREQFGSYASSVGFTSASVTKRSAKPTGYISLLRHLRLAVLAIIRRWTSHHCTCFSLSSKHMPTKQASAGDKPVERVFLIDSMSHIFRAFFAPMANRAAPLATSKGRSRRPSYIFTNMLRKLLREEKPDYIAAIFESREKTFRHETFADYKANRLAMPDDLASQMPYIFRLCEALQHSGDQLSRLRSRRRDRHARQTSRRKEDCRPSSFPTTKTCASSLRDPLIVCMRQNSQVVKRKEPVPPIEWCDEAWVENKFGVPADKLVDLLGSDGRLDRQHSRRAGHRFKRRGADHSAVWIDRRRARALGSQSSTRLIASRCATTRI